MQSASLLFKSDEHDFLLFSFNKMLSLISIALIATLNSVQPLKNLDLPTPVKGSVLDINLTFKILDISSFKLVDMEFRLDYFLTYTWSIHRTTCDFSLQQLMQRKKLMNDSNIGDEYMVRGEAVKFFWTPDLYVPEVKKHEYPTTTGNNHLLVVYIEEDCCRLKFDSRLAALVACQMDFHDYPFDEQFCPFRLRSHYYPMNYVNYKWSEFGVSAHKFIKLNNYMFNYTFTSFNNSALVDDGPFSWLEVDFIFERKLSNFIVQVVCPSVIITTVAYANFWVGVETGASRFQMTIVTMLSLVTLHVGVKATIPPVSYVVSVDIWMIFCLLFVWFAAIELAASNYLHKRRNRIIEKRKKLSERRKFIPDQTDKQLTKYMINGVTFEDDIDEPDLSLLLDKIFRVFYPLAFLLFNCIFWPLMLNRKLVK